MKRDTNDRITSSSPVKSEKPGSSRRVFLEGSLIASAVIALGGCTSKSFASEPGVHYGMVIDLQRCTGCRACAVACKAENGVRLGGFRSWVSYREAGMYPKVKRYFLPRLCNHCENAACLKVCPTGATNKRDDGIIDLDNEKCIGCRHCMGACPYNVRYFNPGRDPEGVKWFPSRVHGIVDKCSFCSHRVDNGIVPSCVNTCPAKARIFGDLNNPGSEISQLFSGNAATTLLPEFGTKPSVFYIGDNPNLFADPDLHAKSE